MSELKKAIFLDRDGVINNNSLAYYIYKIEDFIINEGVIEALKILSQKGYIFIIITNQGGIAKKQYNNSDVYKINNYFTSLLKSHGIDICAINHCPHHSDISKCLCRKPGSLLLEKAIARFGIDTDNSYMIGDSERDILAAEKLKIKGIKVKSNSNLFKEIKQSDYSFLLD
jgi:D-glycero-D-manno-heptose 1,7-bisphosphate phosphatase